MTHTNTDTFQIANNVREMRGSATLAAMQAAAELRATGCDVIDLSVGEPDFDTPAHIKQAAIEAMQAGATKYTPTAGVKPFQRAVVDFYRREFNAEFETKQVVATDGGKQAIFNAVCAVAQAGDEVLIPQPYWVSFPEMVRFTGATPIFVDTQPDDFVLTAAAVKRAISPQSRILIVNSPNNPTGRVIPADEFRRIVEVCAENEVLVISDECYLKFVYPPAEVFSVATLPGELRPFLCIAGSFSKTYAMTGWRIGYSIAREEWTKAMLKVQVHSTSHPTSFVQHAAAAAYNDSQETVLEMLAEYKRRREYLIPALREIPGLRCADPEGAFYAWIDARELLNERVKTSADLAAKLLAEEHLVITDGAGFGTPGFVRISYAAALERLQEGVARLKRSIEKL